MSPIVLAQSNKILTSKFLKGISWSRFNFEIDENILLERNSLFFNNLFIDEFSGILIVCFNNSDNLSDLYNLSNLLSRSVISSNFNFFLFIFLIFSITLLVSFSTSKFSPSKFFLLL